MKTYRYFLNDVEVFPEGEWSISYQRNDGQIFFRRIFDGELNFWGADYDLIRGLDCELVDFDIRCKSEIYWQGQFQYPYAFKFDDDSCLAVGTPEVVDEYSCIMNNYETEYDLSMLVANAIVVQLRDCVGALLHTFPQNAWLLGAAAGGTQNLITELVTVDLGCSLTLRSSFLWRDNFANGDNYAANYNIDNYIAGAAPYAGTNRLEYIYCLRNTRVRSSFGGTLCDGFQRQTFKQFETLLREAFNAYWFIDENGDFRIEHHYYFDPDFPNSDYTVGHDLNTVMDRGGRSFAFRRNKYEYETGRLYDQEVWKWQHWEGTEAAVTHGTDFQGVPVFYGAAVDQKSDYVPGDFKEKDRTIENFWTDIFWGFGLIAAGNVDSIGCPGWLLMDIDTATNWVRCEVGALTTPANVINGHLSTANLQDHYHQYDRIFINGDMNTGTVTTFQTAQKHKLQDPIEFPLCCDDDFDPLDRIKTGLGIGEVKAATQKKQSLEVELWYEFDCCDECFPSGALKWQGAGGCSVQITVWPVAPYPITGDKRLVFNTYLFKGNFPVAEHPCGFGSTNFQDKIMCGFSGIYFFVIPGNVNGNVVSVDISGWVGQCFEISIDKELVAGDGTITDISFNGIAQALANPGGFTWSHTYNSGIGSSPFTNPLSEDVVVWDFSVWDISGAPALQGQWLGYPRGNTDAAWVDLIGAYNGNFVEGLGTPDAETWCNG